MNSYQTASPSRHNSYLEAAWNLSSNLLNSAAGYVLENPIKAAIAIGTIAYIFVNGSSLEIVESVLSDKVRLVTEKAVDLAATLVPVALAQMPTRAQNYPLQSQLMLGLSFYKGASAASTNAKQTHDALPLRVSHYELALLSNAVYDAKGGIKLPDDWMRIDAYYPNDNNDLGIATYINTNIKSIVVAVRGSEKKNDYIEDIKLALLGGIPNQIPISVNFLNNILNARTAHPAKTPKDCKISMELVTAFSENDFITQYILRFMRTVLSILDQIIPGTKENVESYIESAVGKERYKDLMDQDLSIAPKMQNRINEAMKACLSSYPDYEVVTTGHSLGGAFAEIVGACGSVPTITFESPGTKELIQKQGDRINGEFLKRNFVFYVSGPNLVNTLDEHIGRGVRVVLNKASNSWKFVTGASLNALKQSTAVGSIFFGGIGAPLVATLGAEATQLYGDVGYLSEQHSLENMIACFNNETKHIEIGKSLKIITWPYRGVVGIAGTKAFSFLNSFNPIAADQPNLRTLFFSSEKDVIEAQIANMPNYKAENFTSVEELKEFIEADTSSGVKKPSFKP